MESLKTEWANLDRNIYVGERLESNLKALTFVSVVSALLGLILLVVDIITVNLPLIIPSSATLFAALGCAYSSHVLKNRKIAVLFPAVFCSSFLTFYILTGVGNGSAVLWSLLAPIGLCYFVSVKFGILFSLYYTILVSIVLYSPLGTRFSAYYSPDVLRRFPVLYATLSIFTGMAMMQYHSKALFEIDHANSLMEEVERQTAVVKEQSRKIEQMSYQTILTLANAIDAKDPYTKGHSTRVSQYSACLAESLGWDKEKINDLRFAALLHDIGKIGVPDSILNNPKTLTDVERDIIRSHTTIGKDMLKDKVMVEMADEVAGSHHERFDGTGYPSGLKGGEIPMEARIVAIADSFDSMSSDRVYRKACEPEYIRRELKDGKGTQFDPYLTDLFLNLWDQGKLNDILNVDSNEDGEAVEASSVILKEVVETFVTQGSKDEIDITTGIMSRNAGESVIAREMKEEEGCLVFMDVDNLKKINDTYGHEAGDRVLHLMGDTLTSNSSDSLCCRLGGDEFLLFLKKASSDVAEERIKKIIRDFEVNKKDDPEICIASISAGLVMCSPEDSYTDAYNK
ncbi:MAG: diguanylate cyclase, partial [Lachnospiraceae bacterium]|nr:diguanylate cyclase [Lachnospiraceae bacterium]